MPDSSFARDRGPSAAFTGPLDPHDVTMPPGHPWQRVPAWAGGLAAAGAGLSAALGVSDPRQFFFSWLVSFLFWLTIALGALYFVLIQLASQSGWWSVIRRVAESITATLPLFALLFVPVLLGMRRLYGWVDPAASIHDPVLLWKSPYLNSGFFVVRAVVYFLCWSGLGLWLYRSSCRQDTTRDLAISARLRRFSGAALVPLGVTQTFAGIDWIMSLSPHWYSTIIGVYVFSGALVGGLAFMALLLVLVRRARLIGDLLTVEHFHDLGKLLFAFTVFWAYIAFSQYFLIWYANLPEETIWYGNRLQGSWLVFSTVLALGHFAVPFFFLLPRATKRRTGPLFAAASWMLAMHYLDLHWMVMPTLHPSGVTFSLLDATTMLAVGGVFFAVLTWLFRRRALVAVGDPRLPESLSFENV